ncbi:hypothetical protein ACHAXA_005062 [Cyclostephanos tholiformis]|uniref:Uncharacterized protein n=1 Tax=Cyclostephanos tholiformis TaxID=382380 RepID=A0ABD3SRT5_9STRA
MKDDVDDLDFVVNGVLGVFLTNLDDGISNTMGGGPAVTTFGKGRGAIVIATGFSNGGFLSSLLGLMSSASEGGGGGGHLTTIVRPSWLVGIVPTGGYQYDVRLYNSDDTRPLPMMSHHGGRDSVVDPGGCCASSTADVGSGGGSNCPLGIGIKQRTCTSVRRAFEMWSDINGCYDTVLDDDIAANVRRTSTNNGNVEEEVDQQQRRRRTFTCYRGDSCIEPTNFCLWNEEGHGWGTRFPGINMTREWMRDVFHRAESRTRYVIDDHTKRSGKVDFSLTVALLMVAFLCTTISASKLRILHCYVVGKGRKRKTSEGYTATEAAEMI